jgi:3',5'-cyclic-AMP phosphodiesterase
MIVNSILDAFEIFMTWLLTACKNKTVRDVLRFAVFPALAVAALIAAFPGDRDTFRFAILGDRTGGAQPGAYEQVWREAAADHPAFAITAGDLIEGLDDASADSQWREFRRTLQPYEGIPFYAAPGNHDIWSAASERLFRQYSGHPPDYSFDYGSAHFTFLDNSRSDELPAAELSFLQQDLETHTRQPLKFVITHRPSWIVAVALKNPDFPLHQLARRYGVHYVIAGHVHQLLHFEFEGVTYLSLPSAGGHLRASSQYADGWFFGHILADVRGSEVEFRIEEVKPPLGQARTTRFSDWGMLGLARRGAGGF